MSQLGLQGLLADIRTCNLCAPFLPEGPRPVLQAAQSARILVAGQAPGRKVHQTGIPFDDASGERLRAWMGVNSDTFYNPEKVAILPMGFCYPGTGKSGDLPPRPECAQKWRAKIQTELKNIQLVLVIGKYAIDWHLDGAKKQTLTSIVKNWRNNPKGIFVLPHPSPRNNIWLRKNDWFESDVIPELQASIRTALS